MSDPIYKVYLVVDQDFGERLASLPVDRPVWIIDSPANTPAIQRLRAERPPSTHLTGITSFVGLQSGSPVDDVLEQLDDIDLHHGQHSSDPPCGEIEVVGTGPSNEVVLQLKELGFVLSAATPEGFRAVREQ